MLPLYDHTRRRICMAAFLALCLGPTLAIAGMSIYRHLPWHRQSEEQRLSQELGVDVSIASIEHTLPGIVRYTGMTFTDPETSHELFRCSELAATWKTMTDKHGQTRPAVVLACRQAESASGDWQRLYEVLRRRLECQNGRPEVEIRVTADHLTLRDGENTQVVDAIDGGVGFSTAIQAQLDFRLPEINASQPLQLWIVRNRQVSPPAYEIKLDTHACPVPCRLLTRYFKEAGSLGPDCAFAGYVLARSGLEGWSGELNGRLTGVDLGRVRFDNGLPAGTGVADIDLNKVPVPATRQVGWLARLLPLPDAAKIR